jgi:hypothetical protein
MKMSAKPLYDILVIEEILPHRSPFLFVIVILLAIFQETR